MINLSGIIFYMWCVIKVGSQQFKVSKDDVIEVERIKDADGQFTLSDVLLFSDGNSVEIGQPTVKNVTVKATVIEEFKAKKVYAFKFRRRKNSKTLRGHRQIKNLLKIDDIVQA